MYYVLIPIISPVEIKRYNYNYIYINMYNYIYVENVDECNICYETKQDFFKCVRCSFKACCKCFNHFYFENESRCPTCRLVSMLF